MITDTRESRQDAAAGGWVSFTTGSVASADGTSIGYRQIGDGPGLIILHGAMSSAYNHARLAEELADSFTVYLPDRRGRGLSGPFPRDYCIQREVEDLHVLLIRTGAHQVFGVSSGGIIALQAALTLPEIRRLAVYEPPLSVSRQEAGAILAQFDEEMDRGRVAAALATGMKAAQMGPPFFNRLPLWLLEPLTSMAMRAEERKGSGDYLPMRALAPTLHYDFQLVAEASEELERFRAVRAQTLLLGGSKSPAYLKSAIDELEKALPDCEWVELMGLDHAASWNADRGGRPEAVAQALYEFFSKE